MKGDVFQSLTIGGTFPVNVENFFFLVATSKNDIL
jgi:hypothetical protein